MGLDDDDIDLFGVPKSNQELSSLLSDLQPARRLDPTPTAPAAAAIRTLAEHERTTVETERATLEAPQGYQDVYGLPGTMPWEKMAYAYRVHAIRGRALERAFFLAEDIAAAKRALPDVESELGRAAHDAASARRFTLPDDALSEVRSAMEALSSLAVARDEMKRSAERDGALASARRESAAASLDPVSAEESRALGSLEAAERALDRAKAASASAEAHHREAIDQQLPDAASRRSILDEAQRDHAAAARATRDAALAYAEVRRRAVLQAGRLVEADRAVEGARIEHRRADRDLRRREDESLRALREAYAKLGGLVFESGIGKNEITTAFALVYAGRERIRTLEARLESLRELASGFDSDAVRDGRTGFMIVAAVFVFVLVLVAAFA